MPSIPSPGSGPRKSSVSIGGGTRRKDVKPALGAVRIMEPPEPGRRRKVRKGSKPAKWTNATKAALALGIAILLIGIGGGFLHSRGKARGERAREDAAPAKMEILPVPKEELPHLSDVENKLFSKNPKGVATSFAYAKTIEERSLYALDASNVPLYSDEARTAIPTQVIDYGSGNDGAAQYAQFRADFPDGESRLIAVIPTEGGPKVDWDCYASLGTAGWPDILGGAAEKAEVRVLVRPSHYYNFSFSDDGEWIAYELTSPDFENNIFAYAKKGGDILELLENVFVHSDGQPCRLIIELSKSPEGLPHRQFLLTGLLSEGWVRRK